MLDTLFTRIFSNYRPRNLFVTYYICIYILILRAQKHSVRSRVLGLVGGTNLKKTRDRTPTCFGNNAWHIGDDKFTQKHLNPILFINYFIITLSAYPRDPLVVFMWGAHEKYHERCRAYVLYVSQCLTLLL